MQRTPKDFLSRVALEQVLFIPRVFLAIRNWPTFLLNYIGLRNVGAVYQFRNGLEVKTKEGVDAATVFVVFARREYGQVACRGTIIDISANIGAFSLYAARSSAQAVIYAYEPMATYAVLLDNIRRNGLERRIIAARQGVAGKWGPRRLYDQGGSPFNSLYPEDEQAPRTEIECVTLADIFEQHQISCCDLLKLDCEGSEFEILYAARPEDLARIRRIRVEYHNRKVDPSYNVDALLRYLREHGFAVARLHRISRNSGALWLERHA